MVEYMVIHVSNKCHIVLTPDTFWTQTRTRGTPECVGAM